MPRAAIVALWRNPWLAGGLIGSAALCGIILSANRPMAAALYAQTSADALNLDLAAELDHPVGRDAEEFGGIERHLRQQDEQPVAPAPEEHAPRSRPHLLAADKERGVHQVDVEMLHPALRQGT